MSQEGEWTHPNGPLKEIFRVFGLDLALCDALESRRDTLVRQLELVPVGPEVVIEKILGGPM